MTAHRIPSDPGILPTKQLAGPLSNKNIQVFSGTPKPPIISLNNACFLSQSHSVRMGVLELQSVGRSVGQYYLVRIDCLTSLQ